MSFKLISVVTPVFNEESSIEEFVHRVSETMKPLKERYQFEIILIDDGSWDRSLEIMKELVKHESHLRVIELRRNYGQAAALQAGLDAAHGEILITLDADLQHFPEEIPKFIEKLEEGYDMVCGWRHQRAEGVFRRWPSRMANYLISRISGLYIHDFGTTYRAYLAGIVKEIRLFGEFHRFIPVLGKDLGARVTEIPIQNIERPLGQSKYGIKRTFGVFLDIIVLFFFARYMDRPMRAFGKLGMIIFAFGVSVLATLVVYANIFGVPTVRERQGWFLMSLMLIIASIQIFFTGILAEFIMRTHYGQGDRRVYKVRREWKREDTV